MMRLLRLDFKQQQLESKVSINNINANMTMSLMFMGMMELGPNKTSAIAKSLIQGEPGDKGALGIYPVKINLSMIKK